MPLNKSTTYHAPPPPVAIFFAPTSVPQSDQRDEAAISHHICRGLEPPPPPAPSIAPLERRRDTSLRVGKPKHGEGRENAVHERALNTSGHESVGGLCTHGVVLKRHAPHTVRQ